ncbi:unnamed protein product [Clonostachys chloroleuca]|uniref:Uncharacterized protein n=1 Tax=Clonostachys chloroleuca TaxID=1926264 RepID=A0AA35Q5J0_9HYPO|nr:unnamed protein product [Clonostachys chloroleuca]
MRFMLAHLEKIRRAKLKNEAETLRRCLASCAEVDTYVESQISNIDNHAEGNGTIEFLVSMPR